MPYAQKRTPPIRKGTNAAPPLNVADLAGVVYSSGKVFDGLRTGRLDTENFLRSGSLEGITSKSDLALLEDLRDVSQFIIDNREAPLNSAFVRAVNAQITRSGPMNPGHYRTAEQHIGVSTQYGRHEPQPTSDTALQRIIDRAMSKPDPREQALELFVQIAKAQPFEDGNKRTALFVANSVLIRAPKLEMLVVPVDENSPDKAARFNDLLARAYVSGEHEGVKDMLRTEGFTEHASARDRKKAARMNRYPKLRDMTLNAHALSGDEHEDPQLG
ncbi:hypothetical protein ABIE21_001076 [Conyzicola nivalis]|uniref:Fido domain-containing protein n=1 Tax=Conyzicola nivalis TaxID=1477021 RepID=A0ABV2QKL2_9MICO